MAEYTPRLTAPSTDNRYFYGDNVFYQSGYGLPNCTAYAWGRFYELTGDYPKLGTGDAETWYGKADGYSRGKTPKLGAVICWRKGVVGDDSDGAGHVAIVEQINADGSIVTSNSAWGGSLFYTETLTKESNYSCGSAYTFQGFIYNPIDFEGAGLPNVEPITGNRFLSKAEMENNARYIWNYLGAQGWSLNAVAGMLGNMQTESTINPGIWESLDSGNTSGGFGLVQWTPATKLISWANSMKLDYQDMDTQLERIEYELANGIQYYPTPSYPETFKEFKSSTKDPYYLGMAFLANYERPAVSNQPKRGQQAQAWYEFLSELPAPDGTRTKRKGLPLLLMYIASKRKD